MPPVRPKVEAWSREDLLRALSKMLAIAVALLIAAWLAYLVRFSSILEPIRGSLFGPETHERLMDAKAAWGQLGDFIGGTLNPIVSLFALVGLVFTIMLQHEAMKRAQADAEASQSALTVQVRLSLESTRLQSLVAALQVATEQHRQASDILHPSASEFLEIKERLARQILEINERLAVQVTTSSAKVDSAAPKN